MANSNSPHGFGVVALEYAAAYSAQCHMYSIPTSDAANTYSIGDAVKSLPAGGGDAQPNIWGTFGIQNVVKSIGNAGDISRGIVISVFRNPFNLDQLYVPQIKAQTYYVLVMDDPNAQMVIQPDGSASYAATWNGANAAFSQNAVNAANVSNTTLTATTPGTGATLPLKILGVQQQINISTGLYVPMLVTWNSHELKSVGTTGAA